MEPKTKLEYVTSIFKFFKYFEQLCTKKKIAKKTLLRRDESVKSVLATCWRKGHVASLVCYGRGK